MNSFGSMHGLKFAVAIAAALALGACSKNPTDLDSLNGSGAGGSGGVGAAGSARPGSTQDFVVNVGDRVFFDSDSSEINGAGQATLDKQANWLNQYRSYAFTVEGHADERGTREYNFALGARRAESAKNYLVARGVSASRIKTISYGKERPVAVCDDISCWSQNRRAVTVLKPGS
ncbi:peptidoglycan-associated lipoprotein [Rhodoblastus sphagnicola]|uniref:Peptidoglycan-associated protein n=1 Tax=Rhodoblastus sphagnicola TaxID=333368 RepID=A0A2S6NC04_9HYPH|nr:peptidoglycan-associated lipoprotein Pal [Rhodoblastus sphagnicola]MBB4198673.1 peptidoglycan-associated lipoprotein [Rhodoblastus sphagnicola]PPQ32137.1 peptidoglycan-associated lipoprotein [Rhodoblastus sphagnicola]